MQYVKRRTRGMKKGLRTSTHSEAEAGRAIRTQYVLYQTGRSQALDEPRAETFGRRIVRMRKHDINVVAGRLPATVSAASSMKKTAQSMECKAHTRQQWC